MSVLRRAKLRTPDGTESIEYPLGVEAENVEVTNGENLSQRLVRIDEDLIKNKEDITAVNEIAVINRQNIGANEIRINALERRSISAEKVEVANQENLSQRLVRIDEDIAAVNEIAGTNRQNIGAAEERIDALERKNISAILAFNNIENLKNATNLVNGSIVRTLGTNNYFDGYGNYYKIRNILNTDVVDNINIIPLTNFNDLIAEKIPDNYIIDIYNTFGGNRSILLSDSYFDWSPDETIIENNRYWKKFFNMMGITDYYAYNKGGIGFYQKVDNENFLSILQNHYNDIQDKDTIKNIFVFGGYNDAFDDNTTIQNINDAINDFVAYCKTNYPNAKVYIGEIGYDVNLDYAGTTRRNKINNKVIPAYCNTTYNSNNPYIYLPNLNYCLHNKDYMSTDGIHPNTAGHNALANGIYSAFNKGFECLPINEEYPTITPINYATGSVQLYVKNTPPAKVIRINNFYLNWDNSHLQTFSENQGIAVASTSQSKTILPVYDIPFCTFGMVGYSDNTYEILPIKIRFAHNGNIVINVMKLNSNSTGWQSVSNVKYLQIWQQELSTTMNVL